MKKSVLFIGILSLLLCSCYKPTEFRFQSLSKTAPDEPVFTHSTQFTNPYFPARENTTYIYEGETEDGMEHIEERRLNVTRTIMGVECIIVNFRAYVNGNLVEEAFDWYAQDDAGTVWYFGEAVDNYLEDGTLADHAGSWEAGVDGAEAGILMLAAPRMGMKYREEFYPDNAEDEAQVIGVNLTIETPLGTYTNCLKTKNWSKLEPGIIEHKYYAPGVGLVKEVNLQEKEEIFLISIL
ncbi:hypothetical protein [Flavihumibacter sp. ZG627]|uniref:hypothetical protein n=1 Tax=Flavihumibacter sp. ZG627 TaxID=1463156 RepID=UPI0006943932|nr:hypothetical protein [Flavihumibacter sp. ZG627]